MVMDDATQRCMFLTSFFMLVPMYLHFEQNFFFAMMLAKCMVASLVHWHWYKHNSMAHWCDRWCAGSVIVYAVAQKGDYIQWSSGVLAVFCFFVGRNQKNIGAKRNWHLAFRYVAFWMCMPEFAHTTVCIVLLSTVYIGVIVGVTSFIKHTPTPPGTPRSATSTTAAGPSAE